MYVYVKCLIHLLLLVLDSRLAQLPANLRRKLTFHARVASAVEKDKKDNRLKAMISKLQDHKSHLIQMEPDRLGCMATCLCKLIIFPKLDKQLSNVHSLKPFAAYIPE